MSASGGSEEDQAGASVKAVGVIAAWCEDTDQHFTAPKVDTFLSNPEHQQLCTAVAQNWQPSRGSSRRQTEDSAAAALAQQQAEAAAVTAAGMRGVGGCHLGWMM